MINHGYVITKKDSCINMGENRKGIITSYFPDLDGGTFAVKFINGPWLTFKESEAVFVKRFKEIRLNK